MKKLTLAFILSLCSAFSLKATRLATENYADDVSAYRVVNGSTNKVVLVEYAKQSTYEDGYVHEEWFRKKHVERPKTPMKRKGGLKSKFSARRKKIEAKTEENQSAKPIEKTIIFTP